MEKVAEYNKQAIAVDIGGTLSKLAFIVPGKISKELKKELKECQSLTEAEGTSTIYLKRCKSDRIEEVVDFIKSKFVQTN